MGIRSYNSNSHYDTKQLRTTFKTFTDRRTGKNTSYTMTDAGLSAFLVFSKFRSIITSVERRSGCALAFPDVSKLGALKCHVTAGAAT